MIKETQTALIKTAFGKQYTAPAIEFLSGKGLFNSEGEPFSPNALKKIVTHVNTNETVMAALVDRSIEIIEEKKNNEKNLNKKSKFLLKT